jgi:hypothetical protein
MVTLSLNSIHPNISYKRIASNQTLLDSCVQPANPNFCLLLGIYFFYCFEVPAWIFFITT